MKIKVTSEERKKLTHYLAIMNDQTQNIHTRIWAKMMFDSIFQEAMNRMM